MVKIGEVFQLISFLPVMWHHSFFMVFFISMFISVHKRVKHVSNDSAKRATSLSSDILIAGLIQIKHKGAKRKKDCHSGKGLSQ